MLAGGLEQVRVDDLTDELLDDLAEELAEELADDLEDKLLSTLEPTAEVENPVGLGTGALERLEEAEADVALAEELKKVDETPVVKRKLEGLVGNRRLLVFVGTAVELFDQKTRLDTELELAVPVPVCPCTNAAERSTAAKGA